jgi:beta-1,4-mannosyl-glycoprotein beta-1,4-N-acetylglucosaminyltransferase
MYSYKLIKNFSLNELRAQPNNDIENGGWHFSYMGGAKSIIEKLKNGDTQGYDTDYILKNIEKNFNTLSDVINNGDKLTKININDTYPEYIIKNLNKYNHMLLK